MTNAAGTAPHPAETARRRAVSTDLLDAVLVAQLRAVPGRDGATMLDDLVPRFVDDCGERLDQIRAALQDGDVALAAGLAHRMAGSVGTLGARGLAGGFLHFETVARNGGETDELAGLLDDLVDESAQVTAALSAMVG